MNYDEMTDAEIDAAVAERVMGWSWDDLRGLPIIDGMLCATWSPTTDANAMMEVLERIIRNQFWIETCSYLNQSQVRLCCSAGYGDWVIASTLGRAVCIAALRAVESQREPAARARPNTE